MNIYRSNWPMDKSRETMEASLESMLYRGHKRNVSCRATFHLLLELGMLILDEITLRFFEEMNKTGGKSMSQMDFLPSNENGNIG